MFKWQEVVHIVLAIVIIAFALSFSNLSLFLLALVSAFLLLMINILAKKAFAYFLDAKIKVRIWYMQRFGYYGRSYFKNPLPMGLILPFVLTILSLGTAIWLAVTEFDVYSLKSRVAKKIGLYRFSEMTESHIGWIAIAGIVANLIAAILAYLLNFPDFGRLNIYYAAFNMLPLSNLDGTKIFFSSRVNYIILLFLVLIGLIYAFLWV